MSTFHSILKIFAVILAFATPHSSFAGPFPSACGSQEGPCTAFPKNLTYQCVEKGSQTCNPKSPFYKECCEGLLVYPYYGSAFVCAYWPYIPGDSACCDGKPYSKLWEGCCDGRPYLSDYDTCCEGRIVPREACCCNKLIDPETTGCCAGKPYTYENQACCDGKVICASSILLLTPKPCKGGLKRAPSCFYATVEGLDGIFFAQATDDGRAMITLPEALCPNQKVQICMHPQCGTPPKITGNPKHGYVLEGVCSW